MTTLVKDVLTATIHKALHHRLIIDPAKKIMLPRVTHQAIDPPFGKPVNKTFDVRFFSIGENHAITGSHMDGEQHVFALHSSHMNQPLFVELTQFIVLDSG